jgi:hypothetical protein
MFKGKEKGDSRRRTEEKKYHPSVTVIFNEKAYANSTNLNVGITAVWLRRSRCRSSRIFMKSFH